MLGYLDEVIKHIYSKKATDNKLVKYLKRLCNEFTTSSRCNNQIYFLRMVAESAGTNYSNILNDELPGAAHIAELILNSFKNNEYFQVL